MYVRGKTAEAQGNDYLGSKIMEELGLYDDFEFLSQLDLIWDEFVKIKRFESKAMRR